LIVVDTSIAVASALPWHENHAAARSALAREKTPLLGPVAVETYSVLTRLPPPQRVPASLARDYLFDGNFALPPLVLHRRGYQRLVALAVAEGITGGAIYDALVGATAQEAGATLVTLDRRAVSSYEIVGVDYRLVA
jgi:predicted nucleic acid-binding protein